ncbi:hypothetical protein AB0C34_18030 [Nocardia sp. NPDC049220]|uniref:hypothetical protein n=1 Tax=Nocardia sp. NPDC049220 TaxID=3155273 RepID=UPI0033C03468
MSEDPYGISLRAVTRFDYACCVLATLIGHASSRAAIDPIWAVRRDEWMHRLNTLTPRDSEAVGYVLDADVAALRALD